MRSDRAARVGSSTEYPAVTAAVALHHGRSAVFSPTWCSGSAASSARPRSARRARALATSDHGRAGRAPALALFLHDGPVQSLSGIALLLDGVDTRSRPGRGAGQEVLTSRRAPQGRFASCATFSFNLDRSCSATRGSQRPSVARSSSSRSPTRCRSTWRRRRRADSSPSGRSRAVPDHPRGGDGRESGAAATRIEVRVEQAPDGGLETSSRTTRRGERRRATSTPWPKGGLRELNGRFRSTLRGRGIDRPRRAPAVRGRVSRETIDSAPGLPRLRRSSRPATSCTRREGDPPQVGERVRVRRPQLLGLEGLNSPLPGDGRRCAYLQASLHGLGGDEVEDERCASPLA